jgi:hypothetical protein
MEANTSKIRATGIIWEGLYIAPEETTKCMRLSWRIHHSEIFILWIADWMQGYHPILVEKTYERRRESKQVKVLTLAAWVCLHTLALHNVYFKDREITQKVVM